MGIGVSAPVGIVPTGGVVTTAGIEGDAAHAAGRTIKTINVSIRIGIFIIMSSFNLKTPANAFGSQGI